MNKALPTGWDEPILKEIVKYRKGKKPKILSERPFEDSIPYLDIKALEYSDYRRYADKKSSNILNSDSIAIVWDGARSGWVAKGIHGAIGSTIAELTPILIDVEYVYHFLKSQFGYLNTNTRGIGIPHVDPNTLWNIKVPLPPLPEQTRIVAKLDALFIHLDTLNSKLDHIPELLKNFRQQVLMQAVTGKLTEQWRKGKELEKWSTILLQELIVEKPRNGYSPQGVNFITEVKSLTLSATTTGKFNPSFIKYLDIKKPELDSHLWLKHGDILIQRSNSLDYVGTSAIYTGKDYEFIYPDLMMKIRANEKIQTSYLYYCLSSRVIRDYFKQNATGTAGNMPKINQEIVMNTPINLPSIDEQHEIVERVEELFNITDKIDSQYQTLKEKIDNLPQAILNKAFKGELVSQDPNDEPASVLLDRIKVRKGE
jgi:type I restriction enzyme, S subunit